MPVWLAVALGGASGSLLRWQTVIWTRQLWPSFPWGTLIVNVSGSFLIGVIWAYTLARPTPEWIKLGLMAGVMGGFTTFSAFSLDTFELWKTGVLPALFNIAANVALSLAACAIGMWLARPS